VIILYGDTHVISKAILHTIDMAKFNFLVVNMTNKYKR